MLISSTIPNLVNGVSQQPAALRLASQAEAQENFYSSVVEGLKRRPGSKHLAKLTAGDWSDAFLHTINRDTFEQYTMSVTNGDLKVYDLTTGAEKTVAFPDGKSYLTAVGENAFRAVTVADYTFLVNRETDVAMLPDLNATRNPQALLYLVGANYAKRFKVIVNGSIAANYKTPDGSTASDVDKIATSYVIDQLKTGLDASLTGAEWTITKISASVIHIENNYGNPFTLKVEDDFNNAYLRGITDVVQRFSDLPNHAKAGFMCEVTGEASSNFDNYYVQWDATTDNETSGVWKEVAKWSIPYRLDPATMPHILVREADGTFTFKQADWDERSVGDEDSAPNPSFVDQSINDVFFFRNRLGMTAGENVILSRAGKFFNFFPATVTTILDSDPIDIGVSHVKVSTLNHAVPFNQNLLLFSSQTQFILSGGDILTPSTVSVNQTTEFEGSGTVRPVGAGQNIYFPVTRGSFSGVREYYAEHENSTNNAADITSHCPKYVPGDIRKLVASSNEDILLALTSSDPDKVYVYKYFFGAEGKLQSSWSRWSMGAGDVILDAAFIETTMYLVTQRADGVYLDAVDVETGAVDEGSEQLYRVDRKVYESDMAPAVFDGTHTTWTLPFQESAPLWVFIRAGDAQRPEGYVLNHTCPTDTTVQVKGDWTSSKVCIGRRYTSEYEFSTFLIKEDVAGGGQASVGEGRLQVAFLTLEYYRAGYFEVHVTPDHRDTYVYKFTGRILGSGNNVLGQSGLETGRFKVPVQARNTQVTIKLKSDHFLPCTFMSAEWEARYNTRSRRL